MYVDALALAALMDELRDELMGGRVDDVIQPTPHAIALQCYAHGKNQWLLVSAHTQFARVHRIPRKPLKLVAEPPAFVMLLRKYLEGARIVELRQPRWERVLEICCAHGPGAANVVPTVWLVIEVIGKLSNIILRDEQGVILGALHQVSAEVNHYRAIQPHAPYRYPPPRTRRLGESELPQLDPASLTAADLAQAAGAFLARPAHARGKKAPDTGVAAMLADQILGCSRDLGAEAAMRAFGAADASIHPATDWAALARAVHELAYLY
ncbi:MAG: NFACT family protein, partial [Ktedonobacterales bacterium]